MFALAMAARGCSGTMLWCRKRNRGYGNWTVPGDRACTTWTTREAAEKKRYRGVVAMERSMSIKRIVVDVDMDRLSFSDIQKVAGAIATLELLAAENLMGVQMTNVRGRGALRKRRVDAKPIEEIPLQPQAAAILDVLRAIGAPTSVRSIAIATQIKEQSVRGQLHRLLKRKMVIQCGKISEANGKKRSILWRPCG